jgi:hypothetical protein
MIFLDQYDLHDSMTAHSKVIHCIKIKIITITKITVQTL